MNVRKIELRRAELCMSSKELQQKSGLPRGTYLGVINGKNIRPETLGKVAKALGVNPAAIIETEE